MKGGTQIPEQKSPSFKTGPIGNSGLLPFGVGHSESRETGWNLCSGMMGRRQLWVR